MTDAFYCLRYLAVLLADHVFAVEVSTDTDPLELRLGFQKRPAVFLFAWVVLEEDVETALSALERRIAQRPAEKGVPVFPLIWCAETERFVSRGASEHQPV